MSDIEQRKVELRRILRQRRATLTKQQRLSAAAKLCLAIRKLTAWSAATRIALYVASDGEIDTAFLAQQARASGKDVFLPVVGPEKSLTFALWQPQDNLQDNQYNIPEPTLGARRCELAQLDILFLPLVGWDGNGRRLGMGGGFYDRALATAARPILVGLAHECQRLERVPVTDRDVSMDFIATDTALHHCKENAV